MESMQVVMIRKDMKDIPQFALPEGFSMRPFRDGDRQTWLDIQGFDPLYKVTGETFDKTFGVDLPAMARRSMFLVAPDGRDIGTITAWYDRKYAGKAWGRIHWVSIVPDFRGRGLGKGIMTVAMNRLRALGHRRAILGTQTPRLNAIKLYLDFGFVPDMTTKDAVNAWAMVAGELKIALP